MDNLLSVAAEPIEPTVPAATSFATAMTNLNVWGQSALMIARLRERKRHAVVLMGALQRQCDKVDEEIEDIKREKVEFEIAQQYITESYEKLRLKRKEKETASKELMALKRDSGSPYTALVLPRQSSQPHVGHRSSVNPAPPEPPTKEPSRTGYGIDSLEDSDPEPDDADDQLPPTPDGQPLSPRPEVPKPVSPKIAPPEEEEEDIYGETENAGDDSIAKQFGMIKYNRGSMPY